MKKVIRIIKSMIIASAFVLISNFSFGQDSILKARVNKLGEDSKRMQETFISKLDSAKMQLASYELKIDSISKSITYQIQQADSVLRLEINATRIQNFVPIGAIIEFSGDITKLPPNWKLCNGDMIHDAESPLNNQQLPDLRGKFLRGVEINGALSDQGGQDFIYSHFHPFSGESKDVSFGPQSIGSFTGHCSITSAADLISDCSSVILAVTKDGVGHTHSGGHATTTGTTDPAGSQDNRPKYFSVYFIMKIK